MTSTATSEEFLFFLPDLRLTHTIDIYRETGVDPETPTEDLAPPEGDCWSPAEQILHHPERRLAWHLIGGLDPGPPTWFQLAKASLSFRARLRRAQELLRHSADLDHGKFTPGLWQLLEKEWRWVARSTKARRILQAFANQFGAEDSFQSSRRVLDAIEAELLPVLSLRSHFRGDVTARTFHRWNLFEPFPSLPSNPAAELYLGFLRQEYLGIGPYDHASENVAALLAKTDLPDHTRLQIRVAAGHLLRIWLESWSKNRPTLEEINRQIRRLRARSKETKPQWILFETIAALYALRAHHHLEEGLLGDALQVAGVALTYNPFDGLAASIWQEIDERIAERRVELPSLTGRARTKTRRALEELVQIQQLMSMYPRSEKGLKIQGPRDQALGAELICRIGLDPDSEATPEALTVLRSCLVQGALDTLKDEDFGPRVRDLATARHPSLATINWEPILAALEAVPDPDLKRLALLLPESKSTPFRSALDPPTVAKAKPLRSLRRWQFQLGCWVFSRHDLLPKVAGAIGVVLVLQASALGVRQAIRDSILNHQYEQVLERVRQGDDDQVLARAPRLLDGFGDADPRAPQVQSMLSESLLRQVLQRMEVADEEGARALLFTVLPQEGSAEAHLPSPSTPGADE